MDKLKDKIKLELVPMLGIAAVAEVMEKGLDKYPLDNWRSAERLNSSANDQKGGILRHLTRMEMGEIYDPETGIRHEYHIAARALMWAASIRAGQMSSDVFRYGDKKDV